MRCSSCAIASAGSREPGERRLTRSRRTCLTSWSSLAVALVATSVASSKLARTVEGLPVLDHQNTKLLTFGGRRPPRPGSPPGRTPSCRQPFDSGFWDVFGETAAAGRVAPDATGHNTIDTSLRFRW